MDISKATDLIHSRLVSLEVTKNVDIFCPLAKILSAIAKPSLGSYLNFIFKENPTTTFPFGGSASFPKPLAL
jgi:hypothetical protein